MAPTRHQRRESDNYGRLLQIMRISLKNKEIYPFGRATQALETLVLDTRKGDHQTEKGVFGARG
jgi:hypothetical protein